MKRLLSLYLALAACGGFFFFSAPAAEPTPAGVDSATPQQVTPDLAVRELQPGLWLHTSWQLLSGIGRYPANGLLVREDDHLVLIDTPWNEATTDVLLDWADRTLHLPVARAIVTHAHDDRMGGAPALVRRHIPFFGHPLTARLAAAKHWPAPESLAPLAAPGTVLPLGPLEIFFPGAGHTRDNLVVWLPRPQTLFGGCLVKNARDRSLGNVADADLAEWPASMLRIQQRYGRAMRVVPGHGDPGGPELLQHTLDLLAGRGRP